MASSVWTDVGPDRFRVGVEAALKRRRFRLSFPSFLEQRFERDGASRRCHELVTSSLVALIVYDLFLIADWLMVPDVIWLAFALRVAIVTPLALATIALVHRRPPAAVREACAFVLPLLVALSGVLIFSASRSPLAAHYHYGTSLVLIFANVVLQLRFLHAVLSSTITLAIYGVAVVASPVLATPVKWTALAVMAAIATFTLIANWRLERNQRTSYLLSVREQLLRDDLAKQNHRLRELSASDPLTGVANRRFFEQQLSKVWRRARVGGERVGILMVDVDHFKAYNDLYGHLRGDECLRMVAKSLQRQLRRSFDYLARYGGEEFVVVLPGLDVSDCLEVAERMRRCVDELALAHEAPGTAGHVTVSIGVAARALDTDLPAARLVSEADAAMYAAKRAGRNRVACAPPATGTRDTARAV